ncbi:uncharacterized protein LOC125904278 [Epinephelus fuscoguttatus]|uniref:uncharacterized protein LOC125904278 n=1 Tax=Epinephelus fuscoguttatus TaxID=293821 RepID=UPI0020D1ECFF|nr:uncharacterized protein LOC125904278 [Epinephelus fuscoguttatus]
MPEPAKKNQIKNLSPPIRHAASTRKTLPEPPKKLQRNKPSPATPTSQTPEPWSMDLFMPPPKLKTQASQLSPTASPTMGSADNTWIPDLTSTPCTPKTVKGRKNLQRRLLTSSPSVATTSSQSQTEFSQTTNRSPRTDLMQYRLAVQKKKSTTKDLHQLKPSSLHRQSPRGGMTCGVTCIWVAYTSPTRKNKETGLNSSGDLSVTSQGHRSSKKKEPKRKDRLEKRVPNVYSKVPEGGYR